MTGQIGGICRRLNDIAKKDAIHCGWIQIDAVQGSLGSMRSKVCCGEILQGPSKGSEGSSLGSNEENAGHDACLYVCRGIEELFFFMLWSDYVLEQLTQIRVHALMMLLVVSEQQ